MLNFLSISARLNEKLTCKDSVEDWIEDFVDSDDERFDKDSKRQRIKRALGAYYGKCGDPKK